MQFEYFYGRQCEQYAFYRIPKLLFTDSRFETLSTDAKLLYGMMIDRIMHISTMSNDYGIPLILIF